MKTLAVIIAVNFDYFKEVALKAITKYYNHFEIPVEVLTVNHPDVESKKTSPVWNKSLMFDLYPEYDFVIAQDLDLVPCNLKYNILDFIDERFLNLCIDFTIVGKHYLDTEQSGNFPHFRYNSGLTCYSRKYKDMMREIYEFGVGDPYKWGTFDQYYVNKYFGERRIYVNILPQIFNTFWNQNIDYNKTAFCHYTYSMTTLQKKEYIEKYHPKEMLV